MSEELNNYRREAALKWIKEKYPNLKCPLCKKQNFQLSDCIYPLNFPTGQFVIAGGVIPQFIVICENCGHSLYFNAIIMGIIKANPVEEKPKIKRNYTKKPKQPEELSLWKRFIKFIKE